MYKKFRYFINHLKNIANMHREHDVEHDVSLRIGKHRIVKKINIPHPPCLSISRTGMVESKLQTAATRL